jgi:hypothetical protein
MGMDMPKRVEDLTFAVEQFGGIMELCQHGNSAAFIATARSHGMPCNIGVPACKEVAECPELAEEKAKQLAADLLARNQLVVYRHKHDDGWRTSPGRGEEELPVK